MIAVQKYARNAGSPASDCRIISAAPESVPRSDLHGPFVGARRGRVRSQTNTPHAAAKVRAASSLHAGRDGRTVIRLAPSGSQTRTLQLAKQKPRHLRRGPVGRSEP